MRQLLPHQAEVDAAQVHAADARPAPPGRPWLMINMIASIDGGTAVSGRSGALGTPADKEVFRAIRAVADIILVGAGTARAERYGQPRTTDAGRAERRSRGQDEAPRLALVSRRLEIDPDDRMFTEPGTRPLIVTVTDADPRRRAALAEVAEVVEAGTGSVDPHEAMTALGERGAQVVLAEGGPSLNGQLIAAGLVDEVCLSLSAMLLAGSSDRMAHHPGQGDPHRMRLDRLLSADDLLFLRYVRRD